MDKLRIDSHKLIYHPQRVCQWLEGKNIYPIYIEIAPSGACNHRCIFCGLDYIGYKKQYINTACLNRFLETASQKGVKSIMYAGEGEPLLHKDITEIVNKTKENNIDAAITTNGVYLTEEFSDKALESLSWARVSLNAGKKETYAKIHRTKEEDFVSVINNIKYAVEIRDKNRLSVVIGAQILLLPQNFREITTLAKILKDIGADYLIIKPYSKHPLSKNDLNTDIPEREINDIREKLSQIETERFNIIFREHTLEKLSQEKPYRRCLGISFWTYINANGDVYACSSFLGDENFCFGNICRQDFEQIWEGEKRKRIMDRINNELDARNCRQACRLDEINRYLWQLKHPPEHVNFI